MRACFALPLAVLLGAAPSAAVDSDQAVLVTEIVTAALGKEPRLDVVASADVRRQLELDAEKQGLGCTEATSCLAEVAGALGARLVVYGTLGQLDDVVVLTLNLFDSEKGTAAGRVVIQQPSLKAVADAVGPATQELVAPFVKDIPEGTRAKLLVLDVKALGAVVAAKAPGGDGLALAGIGSLGAGALIAGVGGLLLWGAATVDDETDKQTQLDAISAAARYDQRDALVIGSYVAFGVGGAALVAGAGFVVADVVE